MRTHMIVLTVLLSACDSEPVETDPPDDEPTAPMINLIGEWWMPTSDRLPTQEEGWCANLTPDRFDDSRCFREPTSCEQGLLFDTPGGRQTARWLVIVQGTECGNDIPTEVRASNRYGFFEWLGRTDQVEGQELGDLYRVNARQWEVREDPDAEQEVGDAVIVTSEDTTFHLVEDYRWDE